MTKTFAPVAECSNEVCSYHSLASPAFFFLDFYFCWKGRQADIEKNRHRERSLIHWLASHVATMAGAEVIRSQEPGYHARSFLLS